MEAIVNRLLENRQIELAKEILESNGYLVEKSRVLSEDINTEESDKSKQDFNRFKEFIETKYPNARWTDINKLDIKLSDFTNEDAKATTSQKSSFIATQRENRLLQEELQDLLGVTPATSHWMNLDILSGAPDYEIDINNYGYNRGMLSVTFDYRLARLMYQSR